MVAVFDPEVYGEPVHVEALIAPEVYGESEALTGPTTQNPPSGLITISGGVATTAQTILPPSGVITIAGGVPSIAFGMSPPSGLITISGGGPLVTIAFRVLIQPFFLGSAYKELTQPFDLLGPLAGGSLFQPFDLLGPVGKSLSQLFDLLGPVGATLDQLFDLGGVSINEIQVIMPGGVITGGTYTLTFDGQTTAPIAWNADAATVQAALEALSNLVPGDMVVTGGPLG